MNALCNPLVSVLIITYNQERYIAECIDSIINQKADFLFEVVIADDCSTDGTSKISKNYQEKFPDKIIYFRQEKNLGIVKNYIYGLKNCRGKYIAQCAGDDYWIDESKLSKQVAFLEHNSEYGAVSTGGYRLLVKKNKFISGIPPLKPVSDGNVFELTWKGGVYAMPLSLMFRSSLFEYINFDEFIKRKFSVEDVPMQAIMAKYSKFGHIPDLTCVYRVHSSSATFITFNKSGYIYYHEGLVAIRKYLNELFPNDVIYSEQWAHDYMAYRRFLVNLYNLNYKEALTNLNSVIKNTKKIKRAKFLSKTYVGFFIFSLIKRMKLYLNVRKCEIN